MQVNQVFVHSKVLIVDNACAICGSANMDGVSLHSYGADFSGIGRRIFHNVRNFDINVTVTDDASDRHPFAASLQNRLWSEHLGADHNSAKRPAAGWLAAWREVARSNIMALQNDRVPHGGAFILPFIARSKPSQQLHDLGVDATSNTLELLFNPGWFERRFNLRWVRNMFL
jgi:phosphatidylserine/phosphatidylglycerophosphate/cardiolipin synthase-like enzyme